MSKAKQLLDLMEVGKSTVVIVSIKNLPKVEKILSKSYTEGPERDYDIGDPDKNLGVVNIYFWNKKAIKDISKYAEKE